MNSTIAVTFKFSVSPYTCKKKGAIIFLMKFPRRPFLSQSTLVYVCRALREEGLGSWTDLYHARNSLLIRQGKVQGRL